MITDLIVSASVLLALAFVAAWGVSPRLRRWVEQPKYRFQDALADYDRLAARGETRRAAAVRGRGAEGKAGQSPFPYGF